MSERFKHFKAISEDENCYTVEHPNGKKLFIEKAKLSQAGHKAIQHLYKGAMVENDSGTDLTQYSSNPLLDSFSPKKEPVFVPQAPAPAPSSLSPADRAAYAQFAPDLSEAEIKDLGAGGKHARSTNPASVAERAKLKAKVDSIRAVEGPVSGDPDYVSSGPSEEQAVSRLADQQGSYFPDGRAPDSDPLIAQKQGIGELLGEQVKQQQAAMEAGQLAGQEAAAAQDAGAMAIQKLPTANDIAARYQEKDQKLSQAFAETKLDPQSYYKNMGTGGKILTGIGMVLSGMGAATSGQPNYALSVMNDAIARDVEAQKMDQTKHMNLWKMNREAMGNDMAANLATENQIKAGVLAKLQAAQLKAALPEQKLRAQQAIDQLKMEMLNNNLRRGLLTHGEMVNAAANAGNPSRSSTDPAMLVPEMVKDPAQQKEVYQEIKNRQNIAQNGQKMLNLVQKAIEDTSGLGRISSMAGYEPASVKELKNLMGPNFANLDGTVRQAAADIAYNEIIPSGLDTPERSAGRLRAMRDWIQSQKSAPVAKGNYIDLDRFASTHIPSEPNEKAPIKDAPKAELSKSGKPMFEKNGKWYYK